MFRKIAVWGILCLFWISGIAAAQLSESAWRILIHDSDAGAVFWLNADGSTETIYADLEISGLTPANPGEFALVTLPDPDGWIVNLEALEELLPQNHVDPFARISEAEFAGLGVRFRQDIPNLTDQQALMRLAALVAALGDSHTTLIWPPEMIYPVQLRVFQDGIYALATPSDASSALGARLVGINGHRIAEVLEVVETVIPHENSYWLNAQVPNYLVRSEVLMGLGIIGEAGAIQWDFERPDGETISVSIAPLNASDIAKSNFDFARDTFPRSESSNGFYWLELFEDGTLYFKYNAAIEAPDLPMTQFIDILFTSLEEQPVERLVIDLRDNVGGDSRLLDPLIDGLIDHPTRLIVIIGNRTYSSAVLNAVRLSQETNAILIGQPTGGAPNHFGEVRQVDLPNFGLSVSYSTNYFETMPGYEGAALAPDVFVPLTIDDYLAGIDPFYAAVLAQSDSGN